MTDESVGPFPLDAAPLPPAVLHGPTREHWITVSFREADVGGPYCLGKHKDAPHREMVERLKEITKMTWKEIESSTEFAFKTYKDSALKGAKRPSWLDPSIPIGRFKISGKARLFGYREERRFVVLWFDPKHKIVPTKRGAKH